MTGNLPDAAPAGAFGERARPVKGRDGSGA